MEKSCIYKIGFNSCKEFYIGGTKLYSSRLRNHKHQFKKNKHHNPHLQNLVNKFGIEDVYFEIIEETTPDLVAEREQYFLDKLKPKINKSLNRRNIGIKASPELRKKLSLAHLGQKPKEESLKKRSETMKNTLSKLTQEEKIKKLDNARLKRQRKVLCLDTGVIYASISEAERETKSDNIYLVCAGKRKTANGLKFQYYNEL
jgi:group I intron endonuclease